MTMLVMFARDSGAANHVVAVTDVVAGRFACPALLHALPQLQGLSADAIRIWGEGPALSVFAQAGLAARPTEIDDVADAAALLRGASADFLITGTGDVDDAATRLLWRAAREDRRPSVALLDIPHNVAFRFDLAKGERPDFVVAPGELAASRLAELGFESSDVIVIDNLHHSRLRRAAPAGRHRARQHWNVAADASVLLFVSENGAEARRMGRHVEFDEIVELERVLDDVARGRPIGPLETAVRTPVIVIRPHPRDDKGKYERFRHASDPRVIVSNAESPIEAVCGADLVIGMRSALLDDAEIMRRPVHRLVMPAGAQR